MKITSFLYKYFCCCFLYTHTYFDDSNENYYVYEIYKEPHPLSDTKNYTPEYILQYTPKYTTLE